MHAAAASDDAENQNSDAHTIDKLDIEASFFFFRDILRYARISTIIVRVKAVSEFQVCNVSFKNVFNVFLRGGSWKAERYRSYPSLVCVLGL